jgi:hypothetical protein
MFNFLDHTAGQNHCIKVTNKSFGNVPNFKYMGMTINQNCIHKAIKSRLNSENICCHAFQNNLSSWLISENVNIKIYKTIILPAVLYGYVVSHVKGKNRLRVFWNRMLRKIFRVKRDEVTGGWRKLYNEELHVLYSSPDIMKIKSRRRWKRVCSMHVEDEKHISNFCRKA